MSEQAVSYIPNHVTKLFQKNFEHDVQQMTSRLRQYVTIETEEVPGGGKRYDNLASRANMEQMLGRAVPTRLRDAASQCRWMFVSAYDDASVVGRFDPATLGRITNPTSDIATSINYARNRTADAKILEGVLASVLVGNEIGVGPSQQSLTFAQDGGETVASTFAYDTDGATETTRSSGPLTLDQIRKAKEILGTAEVLEKGMANSGETPCLAVRAKDKNALIGLVKLTSSEYQNGKPLTDGDLEFVLGVKLVHTQQVTVGSSLANLPMWLPSAIVFREQNWSNFIDVRADLSHAVQIRTEGQMGVMRRWGKKCVKIQVKE